MNKFFVCIALAMSLTGCATDKNKIEEAASTVTENVVTSEDEANSRNLLYEDCDNGDSEKDNHEYIISEESEIDEQPDIQQSPEPDIAADTDDIFPDSQISPASDSSHDNKVIYLTFDDGPSYNTPKVLDILKQENVKATFFVTGHHKNFVHLIKREYDEGHTIGAHSFSHRYEIYSSEEAYFDDLEKLQQIIKKYTGKRTRLIRFPGGSSNKSYRQYNKDPDFMHKLCNEVRRRGYQYVDWNLSSRDARKGHDTATSIVTMATRERGRNICLLMHDSIGKDNTVEALPDIIHYYKEAGFQFKTLDAKSSAFHHLNLTRNR